MDGDAEPVALRSTASQMQRGSGELQSTPTGFWKLQSDPAGAGHGSIAAGIGAWSFLRSTSLAAHMGRARIHTHGGGQSPEAKIQKSQSSKEEEDAFSGACESSSESHSRVRNSRLLSPIHAAGAEPFAKFNPTRSTSQPILPPSGNLTPRAPSHACKALSVGFSPEEAEGKTPGWQMEECVWRRGRR